MPQINFVAWGYPKLAETKILAPTMFHLQGKTLPNSTISRVSKSIAKTSRDVAVELRHVLLLCSIAIVVFEFFHEKF